MNFYITLFTILATLLPTTTYPSNKGAAMRSSLYYSAEQNIKIISIIYSVEFKFLVARLTYRPEAFKCMMQKN